MISYFHRRLSSRRLVIIGVVVALIVVVFFVVPIVPTSDNPLQLAGFFPRYESASCALFHTGTAYGIDSFDGGRWGLHDFCGGLS
jgi:hypothetical protein